MEYPKFRTGIGQDSHRFLPDETTKPCIMGGVIFEDVPGFQANSDGDVIFHSLCNAITSLTGVLILGGLADERFIKEGITDSKVFLLDALKTLKKQKIVHVAFTLEGLRPHFKKRLKDLKENIASVLQINTDQVGITATTGEGLTDFGCGDGVQCFCVLTTYEPT